MEPYYSRAGVTLYLGDCRDVLPTLARDSADLMVTDPPYGVGYVSNMRHESWGRIAGDDDARWVPEALSAACKRVLRKHRHAYVFGPVDLLPPEMAAKATLIWDKSDGGLGTGDLSIPWANTHEHITFAMTALGAVEQRSVGKGAARLRNGSVLRYAKRAGTGGRHPTEKPVDLLCRFIESSSLLGETVLDPFAGSGSTLVAAVVERRGGIGIEIEEKYAETAAKRCDSALNWLESASSF